MLLDNDVVADGKPQPGSFSRRFGREERVEHLFVDGWCLIDGFRCLMRKI
jgi:hypothetical protein